MNLKLYSDLGGIKINDSRIKKSLKYSFFDGLLANGMIALNETFGVAAAVALQAPPMAIAVLTSMPLLLGAIGQYVLPSLINPLRGRKFYVLHSVRWQALLLFALAFTGFAQGQKAVWLYVCTFIIMGFSGSVTGGLWMAWMAILVPREYRGRHFAWRTRLFSIMYLFCALITGFISRKFNSQNAPWFLFMGIFLAASLFRFGSFKLISKQYESPISEIEKKPSLFSFKPQRGFFSYCITLALFQGAIALAGPFFNLWFLRDLHFDYLTFSIAVSCTLTGQIIGLRAWGRLADKYGSLSTLRVSAFLVTLTPLPFLIWSTPHAIWLINLYGGLVWGGFNIGNFNYLLAASDIEDRNRAIAFASATTGVCVCIATLVGGFLVSRLPILFGWPLQSLFLLSVVLRLFGALLLLRPLPSYDVSQEKSLDIFNQVPGYRIGLGMMRTIFRAFRIQ